MALSAEETFGNFSLYSGDPGVVNRRPAGNSQEDPFTNVAGSKNFLSETPDVKKETLYTDNKTPDENSCEPLESSVLTTNDLSVSSESSGEVQFKPDEKSITQHAEDIPEAPASRDVSKELVARQSNKMSKRVHFNTEVETFTFQPSLSIRDNYNYVEESSEEEEFIHGIYPRSNIRWGMGCVFWKSENNLAIRDTIARDRVKCNRHNRPLEKEQLSTCKYSRFDFEGSDEVNSRSKLKRTKSAFLKREFDDGNGSHRVFLKCHAHKTNYISRGYIEKPGNLSRRLSASFQNLKIETKSLVDKFVSKVTKK